MDNIINFRYSRLRFGKGNEVQPNRIIDGDMNAKKKQRAYCWLETVRCHQFDSVLRRNRIADQMWISLFAHLKYQKPYVPRPTDDRYVC